MVLHRTCWSCGSPFMSTVIRILPAPTRLSGLRWQTPCLSFLQIVCATSQKVPDVEWVLVNIYRINEYVDITFIPSLLSCFQPDNSNRYHDICFVTCPHVGVLILEAPPFQDVLFSARDPLHIGSSGHVFCEPSFPFVFFFFFPVISRTCLHFHSYRDDWYSYQPVQGYLCLLRENEENQTWAALGEFPHLLLNTSIVGQGALVVTVSDANRVDIQMAGEMESKFLQYFYSIIAGSVTAPICQINENIQ